MQKKHPQFILAMAAGSLNTLPEGLSQVSMASFVQNAASLAALGVDGPGYFSHTIATPTGEGLTSAKSFTRARRCVLHGDLRIV